MDRLIEFVSEHEIEEYFYNEVTWNKLVDLRWRLPLQSFFSRPEWSWIDVVLEKCGTEEAKTNRKKRTDIFSEAYTKAKASKAEDFLKDAARENLRNLRDEDKAVLPSLLTADSLRTAFLDRFKSQDLKALQNGSTNLQFREIPGAQKEDFEVPQNVKAQILRKVGDEIHKMNSEPKEDLTRLLDEAKKASSKSAAEQASSHVVPVPASKSRRARLPFPPSQLMDIYGADFAFHLALDAYRAHGRATTSMPCPDSQQVFIHLPDIQSYLQEELAAAYKLLSQPGYCDLWHFCRPELAAAIPRMM